MNEDENNGSKGRSFLGDAARDIGGGLLSMLLEFLLLGVILAVAVGLFFVNPTVGIVVGIVGLAVWMIKTGWFFY